MNKKELRKLYLDKRRNLLPDELETLSIAIVDRFNELSFGSINYVHLYYPITGKQEFNSLLLKSYLEQHYPQIQFALPKSNIVNNTLTTVLWEPHTPLAMNQWGITEPEYGTEIPSELVDTVIVPLLAFDRYGNRLGYGKGFYDRFLSECRPDVLKIGVSYFEPEEKLEEINDFDISLDVCVTPGTVWRF